MTSAPARPRIFPSWTSTHRQRVWEELRLLRVDDVRASIPALHSTHGPRSERTSVLICLEAGVLCHDDATLARVPW